MMLWCWYYPGFRDTGVVSLATDFLDFTNYVLGCDEERLLDYSEFRACEQSRSVWSNVYSEKMINTVLAGHFYFGFENGLLGGAMQYATGRGGCCATREIRII